PTLSAQASASAGLDRTCSIKRGIGISSWIVLPNLVHHLLGQVPLLEFGLAQVSFLLFRRHSIISCLSLRSVQVAQVIGVALSSLAERSWAHRRHIASNRFVMRWQAASRAALATVQTAGFMLKPYWGRQLRKRSIARCSAPRRRCSEQPAGKRSSSSKRHILAGYRRNAFLGRELLPRSLDARACDSPVAPTADIAAPIRADEAIDRGRLPVPAII